MMKESENVIYKITEICFILFAIIFFIATNNFSISIKLNQLIGAIIFILVIHIFKFIKTYFILLEENLPLSKILSIYLKTTFVTIILPFKLGEIFKAYSYGHEMKNYLKGIIFVLVDKFFDAIIIFSILMGYSLITFSKMSILGWLLFVFILVFLIIYYSFPNTYNYLNKYFINKKQNKRNIIILEILEILNDIYVKAKEMISGRSLILFIITFIYWFCEMLYILFISGVQNLKYVIDYINDSFLGITNSTYNIYVYACLIIFIAIFIMLSVVKLNKRSENK